MTSEATSQGRAFVAYEVPLAPDDRTKARLVLPEDLTPGEAERICAVVKAIAMEVSA